MFSPGVYLCPEGACFPALQSIAISSDLICDDSVAFCSHPSLFKASEVEMINMEMYLFNKDDESRGLG
jgi:hypothetical protein